MSGGGGGNQQQPSQQTITNNPIADWAQPTATSLIGSQMNNAFNIDANGNILGSRGFTPFGGQTNNQGQFTGAPISQDQYNQQLQVAGLGVAGPSALQQKSYEGAANLQTPGQFGQASQMADYGTASALGAGQNFQNMATDPGSVQAYMNPYLQASLSPQLAEIQRQYGITGAQQAGQATQQGAFGGGRDAIMAAENERNKNTAMNQVIGQGYNNAFNNAQSQMNTGAQLGLQGAQAGIQGAGQLSNIGTQQLAAQQGVLNTQNQMGSQEQQNQQQVINQALQNYGNQQNYGTTQATNIMNLLRSTPTTQTQTQYQAPPSAASQAAGLGTAGIAGYKLATMAGGGIAREKKFDVGGSVENKLYQMQNEPLTEEIKITPSQTIKNTGNAILKERQLGTTPPPSFAPGGIVAFAEGGESDIIPVEVPEDDNMLGNPMGEFTMPSRIMSAAKPSAPIAPMAPKEPINVFDKAMQFVLPHEGKFVHHKNDKGGATNRGITQKTLSGHLGRKATIDDVKNLDEETAKEIYRTQFFDPIAKKLHDPKAQMVAFNAAIASGPKYANKLIEKHGGNPQEMLKEHTHFMVNDIPKKDPTQKVFVKGWQNRQNDLGKYIEEFAAGGIAHFEQGGKPKEPDYTNDVPYATEAASQPRKEPYPGYDRDKAMYEGIPGGLKTLSNLNPYGIATGLGSAIGEKIRKWGQTPVQEQYKQYYPERYANQSAKDAVSPNTGGMSPELAAQLKQKLAEQPAVTAAKPGMTDEDYNRFKEMNASESARRYPQPETKSKAPIAPSSPSTPDYTNDTPYSPSAASQPLQEEAPTETPSQGGGKSSRDMIQQMLMDRWAKQGKQAEEDKWMALLNAGFGMMGGTSQHAGVNIGQGAQQGIAAHLAAKRNQISEQNSTLTGMLGLEKAHAADTYHQAQLAQNLYLRKAEIDAKLENAQLSHEDRQALLAERIRLNNITDTNTDLTRTQNERQFNMTQLGNMERHAKDQALAELNINKMALMGKSEAEIQAMVAPRIREILKNNRYRDLYKATYKGYDPYEEAEPPSPKDRKPLTSFQK